MVQINTNNINSTCLLNFKKETYHNKSSIEVLNNIESILSKYYYMLMSKNTIRSIEYELTNYLEVNVISRSTAEQHHSGIINLVINKNGKDIPLSDYIYKLDLVNRGNKIHKLLKNIKLKK